MKRLKSAAVYLATSIGVAMAAHDAVAEPIDPRVPADFYQIVPNNGKVSQSRAATKQEEELKTSVTYRFDISNNTTNDLNRVFFSSTWKNIGGTDQIAFDPDTFTINGGSYVTCTQGTAGGYTTLNCSLPSLPPGGSSVSVYVIAQAPYSGQTIQVDWSGGGFEGNGGGNGCCARTGTVYTTLTEQTTDTSYTTLVQSFVKKGGGSLFTGDRWISRLNDQGTTFVKIPKIADVYDTATLADYYGVIAETSIAPNSLGNDDERNCSNLGRFKRCFATEVTIPKANFRMQAQALDPATKLLTIVLRIDSSAIKGGTRIEDVTPVYVDESNPNVKKSVLQCTVDANGNVTTTYADGKPNNLPCWYERFEWKRTDSGWTRDLDKDFQWGVYHDKNGRYTFF